ncbi:hypothetical protein LJC68_06785 [Bacteroidales bacterium OttesenSCG-928-B11]|nr:hypothetical protein [Bacteroidales bacterium OttesenSCG-928-E04]MDL2312566.1 hypothetical protein [Bacteroidales bacterium OttesenSCG-928-B11]
MADCFGIEVVFISSENEKSKKKEELAFVLYRAIGIFQEVLGVGMDQIMGDSREQKHTFPRFILSNYLFNLGLKKTDIAQIMNKKHTTIKYQLKKYADEYKYNPEFKRIAQKVEAILYDSDTSTISES